MILGLIEHDEGKLNKTSLEMLGLAKSLAEKTGTTFQAVLIGENGRPVASELASFGIGHAVVVDHPGLDAYAPDAWAAGLEQLAAARSAEAILAVGTDRGNEVMARLAARTDAAFAANCVGIEPGERYRVTRTRWGGSLLEEAWLPGSPKLVTITAHTQEIAETSGGGMPEVETFPVSLSDADLLVKVSSRIAPESGLSLGDAPVVVGGGRGVGSAEGFAVLEELAGLLGGVVGGSRVATNLGWRPHADQIGQTGTRIAPEIYIACGISGATQHWVGCMGSKTILAINNDPEAPMVTKADYAVIGDLHEIVPAISAAVRKAKGM